MLDLGWYLHTALRNVQFCLSSYPCFSYHALSSFVMLSNHILQKISLEMTVFWISPIQKYLVIPHHLSFGEG